MVCRWPRGPGGGIPIRVPGDGVPIRVPVVVVLARRGVRVGPEGPEEPPPPCGFGGCRPPSILRGGTDERSACSGERSFITPSWRGRWVVCVVCTPPEVGGRPMPERDPEGCRPLSPGPSIALCNIRGEGFLRVSLKKARAWHQYVGVRLSMAHSYHDRHPTRACRLHRLELPFLDSSVAHRD